MTTTARDIMRTKVETVEPEMSIPDLEQLFSEKRVGGFPVVSHGRLVGIVSRTDIVRRICAERALDGYISQYQHYADDGTVDDPPEALDEMSARTGRRVDHLRVRDVMAERILSVSPGESIEEVAQVLVQNGIHRVPVTEGGRLVGIISSLDLVRLVAEGRLRPA